MNPPINGWRIFVHQELEYQLSKIGRKTAWLFMRGQITDKNRGRQKFLKALKRAMNDVVPSNPGAVEHRLGRALGDQPEVWFRVKFLQPDRLFYRYDSAKKIIVYVWVNDEDTLRAYGSKNDAYAVFSRKLASGYPPGSFEELLKQSREL